MNGSNKMNYKIFLVRKKGIFPCALPTPDPHRLKLVTGASMGGKCSVGYGVGDQTHPKPASMSTLPII